MVMSRFRNQMLACALVVLPLTACGGDEAAELAAQPGVVVVSFNTGTSEGMGHDALPDDGYGEAEAAVSDAYYGDGLAWQTVVDDARAFFSSIDADVVAFQEIFYSGECEDIPVEAHAGFVCESWQPGDRTVAQMILGEGWQVACNLDKSDKCAAVRRSFGSFAGCDADLCLDGLEGTQIDGCGSGARIGRGVIERADGTSLTLVNVHGSSGLIQEDQDCRVAQFSQVFVDLGLGDGEPAANGEHNLIMGDLNTDPGRAAGFDESAALWNEHVGEGKRFHFISDVGADAPPSYAGLFNIDHVVSDSLQGSCWVAGLTSGHPAVSEVLYFDHKPVVCSVDLYSVDP